MFFRCVWCHRNGIASLVVEGDAGDFISAVSIDRVSKARVIWVEYDKL
jgi:hypothetical protein